MPSILYRTQKNIRMIPLFNVVGFVPFDLSLASLAVLTLYRKTFRRVWWMSNFHFISQCTRQRKAAGNFLKRIWLPCSHNSEPKVKGRSVWCSSVIASLRMKHFGCLLTRGSATHSHESSWAVQHITFFIYVSIKIFSTLSPLQLWTKSTVLIQWYFLCT